MKKLLFLGLAVVLITGIAFAGPQIWQENSYAPNAVNITGGNITNVTVRNSTATNLTISSGNITIYDYQFIPVDAGVDSALGAPNAAQKLQGALTASQLLSVGWNNNGYDTLTSTANSIALAYSAGSDAYAATNSITLTTGKLYQLNYTITKASGSNATITISNSAPAVTSATATINSAANTYFRATNTAATVRLSTVGATNYAMNGTLYEYTRPIIGRDYSNSSQQTLVFDWKPPADWNAGNITITPYGAVSNTTAPATTETIVFSFAGYCVAASGSASQAIGTAQTSTFTADATYAQYDEWIGTETAQITLPGAATATKCFIMADRLTTGTYAQAASLTGFMLKFGRTLASP